MEKKKWVIVGWGIMSGDWECHDCQGEAVCYADGQAIGQPGDLIPLCKDCARGCEDQIAEVFSKIFK